MELIPVAEAKVQVLHLQQKLYRWSKEGTYKLKRIYNLLYNPYVLSLAWHKLRENKGSWTAGVDGVTVKTVRQEIGVVEWLTNIEQKLRVRTFEPDCVRREWIPKRSNPSLLRPLGIPTLEDRLIQMAIKLVVEPIFEAKFKGCSLGFRPNRGPLHAISTVRRYMNPRYGYEWIIEADLKACFDNIDHSVLIQQFKKKVEDKRILCLLRSFLKVGIMDDGNVEFPVSGSPQGGIISPLLANIYLDPLDEVYHTKYHTLTEYQRKWRVKHGYPLFRFVRYADDFVIIVKGTREHAIKALNDLRSFVEDNLKMELAEEKTGIRHLCDGFDFLGYHFRRGTSQCTGKPSTILLPSTESIIRFRRKVKEITSRSTAWKPLDRILRELNRLIRGWGQYFRYGWVSKLLNSLDFYTDMRVFRWLRKKHQRRPVKWLRRKYFWRDIMGRRRWYWRNTLLILLGQEYRPIRLPWSSENIFTPFMCNTPRQAKLLCYETGVGMVRLMETVLQRQRTGGEPGERKRSSRVRRAAGGNVPQGVRASC
jgi:RNA-directed DNA polymerase